MVKFNSVLKEVLLIYNEVQYGKKKQHYKHFNKINNISTLLRSKLNKLIDIF